MKYALPFALCASLAVSGCGGSSVDPQAACVAMITGDTMIETDLEGIGADVESYCSCFEATLSTRPETTQDVVVKVVSRIAEIREADGVSLEDAAQQIEDRAGGDGANAPAITEAEFELAGEFVDDVRDDLEDNAGQCTFSGSQG